jgi:hypothetical protein
MLRKHRSPQPSIMALQEAVYAAWGNAYDRILHYMRSAGVDLDRI